MAKETMTSKERLEAAVRLQKPDRVPVAPLMSTPGAATLLGLKSWEIIAEGGNAQLNAELMAFEKYGGWDGAIGAPMVPALLFLHGMKVKYPDKERPEVQVLEMENCMVDDYDLISEIGWLRFAREYLAFRVTDLQRLEEVTKIEDDYMTLLFKAHAAYRERNAELLFGTWDSHPFFVLSLSRSMVKFTEDLYYRPEKVDKALKTMVPEWINKTINLCKATGVMRAACVEERASASIYPLEIFERFWWPYTQQIVDALWSEGIVTWFHLDTCWDKNIPYFKKLPKGSAIIDLDGTTDILAAKELLRNHLCISSDVHPALLSLGKPEEVEAYCKKLIDEIGKDGGLILATGCTVPGVVTTENFRAMIETGKTYEFSRK